MTRDLSRLLRPRSVAVIGGGAWCGAVIAQLQKAGFGGAVWPVHPKAGVICGLGVFPDISALPEAPDAVFIGINRDATIAAVGNLSNMGAGGAVCFASGFAEVSDGDWRSAALLEAAGDMPILGPNCYGLINNCDGALLWPDQHGCQPVDRGAAILTQSSNIAINLTMQSRALPISYVVTCGNQAQTSQADIAMALLDDPRVTALGLHIEGFGDLRKWEALARKAHAAGVPVVALKVGRSQAAQVATISHTASLAGDDAGAAALLARLGIARVDDLACFLETLKILHIAGPLPTSDIATISCSGGEASLAADLGEALGLTFPPLNPRQESDLATALGPRVTLANPLDYHTYIWRDPDAMTAAFSAMIDPVLALTLLIVDFPRADRCDPGDWDCVITAAKRTRAATGGKIAMVATLPELMPEDVARDLMSHDVIPLSGLTDGLRAVAAARRRAPPPGADILIPPPQSPAETLTEHAAKQALSAFGLHVPQSARVGAIGDPHGIPYPVVLKAEGIAHKTEAGAVAINLHSAKALRAAAAKMPAASYLIEAMVTGAIAELLVGIVKDPAHGFVLTIGAGGMLTELLDDTVSLIVPSGADDIRQALTRLKSHRILTGYRGGPAADMDALVAAILAIQAYVVANVAAVEEVEVNPLICTATQAIAVDALIRKRP